MRARIYNNILGVTEGHSAILRLNGVGYRASIEARAENQTPSYPGQQFLSLKLGYSHPVDLPIPPGVKTSTPQPTRILLEGIDKDEVTQFAAEIRGWKRPEPYKGKGIFLGDETIRLKAKKIK
jgi:large subunit ribosomal protein L6